MGIKVLVTGGAGYIGSHAVWALQDQNVELIVIDNLSTGVRANLPHNVEFFEVDLNDSETVRSIIEDAQVTAIMHFAGSVVVPESVRDPLKYYDNNTANSLKLMSTAVNAGVHSFIFSSTAAVYGNPESGTVSETSPLSPINPYGASKMMTERMLQDVAAANGINVGILRYFNVAGADSLGRTGQSTPNATHLIKLACQTALGKRDELQIFGNDYPTEDGTGVRDYIHVSDLIDAHIKLLQKLENDSGCYLYNCGYGHGVSVSEIIDVVGDVAGEPIKSRVVDRRPGDPASLISNVDKIKSELNWEPQFDDLQTIVQSALAWEETL